MSNIHGLFSGKSSAKDDDKSTTAYNGNGVASQSPDAMGLDSIVGKAKNSGPAKDGEKSDCKITLYNNGFMVDEGEFRDYQDPGSKEFMEDVKKGIVPRELQKKFNKPMAIGLEDRRKEDYKKPPPPYDPWAGKGTSLGGPQSATVVTQAIDTSASQGKPVVDPSKPTTVVSIRLHNGTQVKLDLNTDHRVYDIAKYIESVAPVQGAYKLVAGFPPKPLEDMQATVEAAKLCKSAITQKI